MSLEVADLVVGGASALGTAAAAVAAWRSANASARTAKSADLTSQRAVEALARFNKVDWEFYVNARPPEGRQATIGDEGYDVSGQALMSDPTAVVRGVTVEWHLTDGNVRRKQLGPVRSGYVVDGASVRVDLATGVADYDSAADLVSHVLLTYPDLSGLGTWTITAGPPPDGQARLSLVDEVFTPDPRRLDGSA